ncbi:hypothetical protein PF008_g11165 [Phytophthora fragariae]|uniref:Protein kinase domain-containing protein n=1 Tax=Phytophthora fragariae TaxID=53985 RepID=A0A6G0RRR9_9STRA|nr:hypothetical protein PF008_g11165 [Phytophthora fragariae]
MGATSFGRRVVSIPLVWTLLNVLSGVTADCAAGSTTLTTEGCSGCGDYDLCLGFSSADECSGSDCVADGDCTYQCMSVNANLSTLVVLIEFGGFKSSKEVAAGGYTDTGYPDLTNKWPSANNDDVTAVSTIDVSSAVTTFIMSGGTAAVNYPQGKVASVTLTADFISAATAVTKVVLQNLDLDAEIASLSSLLPSTVEHIELYNTLLSDFPAGLGDLTSLQQLILDYNYITSVDSLDVIDSLTTLSLEINSIASFTGVFANLEYLYLGDNNLTSIPSAIFSHSHLSVLNLTGNSFESRSLTLDQADFLNSLETLVLSDSDFAVDLECDDMEQVEVQDVTVCLSDGVATSNNRASASSSAGVDGSDTLTSSTAGSSLSTSVIVGIICGILAVVAAAIIFVVYRRRKRNFIDSKLSSTADDHFPSSNSIRERRKQSYGELNTSTGVPMGIPMSASGVAMGIPTTTSEHDSSTGMPTTVEAATTYPSSSLDVVPKNKPSTFLSVWNDPELLSVQVRVEDIEDLRQLGSGAFATVWLVRYRNSQLLASKRLRPERRTKKHTSSFVEEIKLIANFEHPNLVKFIGAAWTIESDLQALLDFGALLTELDTNQIPYSNTRGSNDKILSDMTILHRVATGKLHPEVRSTYFTDTWPSASNDDVTAVGTIKLSSAVKTFIMSGGTAAMNYPQGKVSSVTLTSDFISSATAVTRVVLQNLALAGKSHIASAVALGLQLHHDCRHLGRDRLPYYATLSLESNSITTFTSVFTNLEYLFLGDNNLTSVPTAIYKHSYLKKLNLTGNSFSVREFTREQADFLKDLETLYLSASDFTVDLECDDSEQVAVHDVTICLGSGVTASSSDTSADATSATTSDTTSGTNTASSSTGTDGPDTKTTSSSDSSSSTTTIVGIVCGTVAALLAIFLFILYRRKSKNAAQQKLGDSFEFSGTRFPSIDSDLVLQQQPYGNLRTSAVFGMDIPMTSTEFSMANQTAGGEDDDSMGIPTSVDGSMGIPTSVDGSMGVPTSTQGSSAYPSSMPTVEAAERNPDRFMSIWNDPDLLSVQVRAADVKDLKQLGNGAFGMVWLVRYRDSQLLASKRLRPERRTKKHTAMFIEEIKLVARFDHPNLVTFVGAAWTIESDLQMLLEYMEGGDLRRYLVSTKTPIGWTTKKFDIAIGVIEALVYLHSFVPPLVHRDLKSKNVLLSSDFKAKISDFGASRFRSVENTMTGGVGTGRWLAPEVIRGDTDYGSAADIYSFGALLTELDTNKIPYSNARGSNGKILSDMTILHRVATGKLHPQVGSDCSPVLKELVERCLIEDQSKRPTAAVIAYELRLIKKDMAAVLAQPSDLTLSELN